MKKLATLLALVFVAVFAMTSVSYADDFDNVLKRWTKKQHYVDLDDRLSYVDIYATYYSAEYIEALMQKEADKNLWTNQEMENYKYNFLKALKLDECIPVKIKFENYGPSMHLQPFDIFIKMRIGKKLYKPVDYDKRFNFKFQGDREGLVFFPRYDSKTGKDLLEGAKHVRIELSSSVSPIIRGMIVPFMWDVYKDDPSKLYEGKSAQMLEADRLLKRLDTLKKDKSGYDEHLEKIDNEMDEINKRLDDIQKAK